MLITIKFMHVIMQARIQKIFPGGGVQPKVRKNALLTPEYLFFDCYFVDWFCLKYNCGSAQI